METDLVYLTTKEIADRYRVYPSTVRRWVEKGLLKPSFITPGGHYRFTPADIEALVQGAAA